MNKITWNSYGQIRPYFLSRAGLLKFASSPTFMMEHNFEYEIENDILYIQRKGQFYGRSFCHFSFPPLTLDADYKLEKEILLDVLRYMPVILTDKDIIRYDITKKDYAISHKNDEYVYKLSNYQLTEGKRWRRWRFAVHSLDRDYQLELSTKIDNIVYDELKSLLRIWVAENNRTHRHLDCYVSDFYKGNIDGLLLTYRSKKDAEIKYFELVSKIGRDTIIMLDAKTVDKSVTFCFNKGSLLQLVNYFNGRGYFNAGLANSKNVAISKQLLNYELLKIYRVERK